MSLAVRAIALALAGHAGACLRQPVDCVAAVARARVMSERGLAIRPAKPFFKDDHL
jgi:hypothetical protein